jgi:plasmid stability protein
MVVNLSIKNVPEALAAKLRARAERNHRSLQGELMNIVERAALETPDDAMRAPRTSSAGNPVVRRGAKTIEQIAAEHRVRFPRPISTGPLAVDIIRADRDSR